MKTGQRYRVVKDGVSLSQPRAEWDGRTVSTFFPVPRRLPVGTEFTYLRYVDGIGSDAWPESLVQLDDGEQGRIGFGVTVKLGYLEEVP